MVREYTVDNAKFFLKNYKNLQMECNDFLLNTYQPADKNEISTQKTGRENERNIIKKLDNKIYQENRRVLKCIEQFLKSLDPESYRLIYAKYFYRMKIYDISNKYHMDISTVKRKLRKSIDNLVKILNNF
jgi:hypothetical protein